MRRLFFLLAFLAALAPAAPASAHAPSYRHRAHRRAIPAYRLLEPAAQFVPIGSSSKPLKITKSGTYTFRPGTTITIGAAQSRSVNAVQISVSNVVIENLAVVGGFRGFTASHQSNITLRNCSARACGVSPAGGNHGGSNLLFVTCTNVTLESVVSTDPKGEHCFYASEGGSSYVIKNSKFGRSQPPGGPYQGVFQINSEGGGQALAFQIVNSTFYAKAPEDVIAVMGGGTPTVPIGFTGGTVSGGRRIIATSANGRPSYVQFSGTTISGVPIKEDPHCWVHRQ
jgi:hypothetical protein